jgi:hypothetical protein
MLSLPDGTIGFYFVRADYSPQADAIFAAERDARSRLVEETIVVEGRPVVARHSRFDVGRIQDLFDGDTATLARTAGVNPAVIELDFAEPVRLTGLALTTGGMDVGLTIQVFGEAGSQAGRYADTYVSLPPDPTLDVVFDPFPGPVRSISIEIEDVNGVVSAPVHLREIALRTE